MAFKYCTSDRMYICGTLECLHPDPVHTGPAVTLCIPGRKSSGYVTWDCDPAQCLFASWASALYNLMWLPTAIRQCFISPFLYAFHKRSATWIKNAYVDLWHLQGQQISEKIWLLCLLRAYLSPRRLTNPQRGRLFKVSLLRRQYFLQCLSRIGQANLW